VSPARSSRTADMPRPVAAMQARSCVPDRRGSPPPVWSKTALGGEPRSQSRPPLMPDLSPHPDVGWVSTKSLASKLLDSDRN
jgi:hypothetical protein